ncbi:MAG TPA: HNH endonuclease [Geobacter sp.]|nr:HNH endonuclease [Geobacter sp.]
MRPVRKGLPYLYTDGQAYEKARPGLEVRLGLYCSFCERKLDTGLEVEHIQPKDPALNPHLEKVWSNFLLACKNCNTCKGTKNDPLADWLIPDRDNTFAAFEYLQDGVIEVRPGPAARLATNTFEILNLNKEVREIRDPQGNLLAWDKRTQRMDYWSSANTWRRRWDLRPTSDNEDAIVDLAKVSGLFSIWMTAFEGVPQIRLRLIDAFPGTEKACFDPVTTAPVSPHSNLDGLTAGGKI